MRRPLLAAKSHKSELFRDSKLCLARHQLSKSRRYPAPSSTLQPAPRGPACDEHGGHDRAHPNTPSRHHALPPIAESDVLKNVLPYLCALRARMARPPLLEIMLRLRAPMKPVNQVRKNSLARSGLVFGYGPRRTTTWRHIPDISFNLRNEGLMT